MSSGGRGMSADPGRYWQDSDDPNWSDEVEARFITELSLFNIERAFRPRDDFDVDIHPDTLRGKVLAFYDECDRVRAELRRTFTGRMLFRFEQIRNKLRGGPR